MHNVLIYESRTKPSRDFAGAAWSKQLATTT